MQVALGRLQVSISVATSNSVATSSLPPGEAREEGRAARGLPLERAYRHEQALQRVETDRAHWAHRAQRM
jgi:hypothetical protein